jgi:hypothetical protein
VYLVLLRGFFNATNEGVKFCHARRTLVSLDLPPSNTDVQASVLSPDSSCRATVVLTITGPYLGKRGHEIVKERLVTHPLPQCVTCIESSMIDLVTNEKLYGVERSRTASSHSCVRCITIIGRLPLRVRVREGDATTRGGGSDAMEEG